MAGSDTFVQGCLACDVLAGRVRPPGGRIFEDVYWVVDHSVSPVVLAGFLIIKPKRHCEQIAELSPAEMAAFGPVLHLTTRALANVLNPGKIYVCSFGEEVKHVHWYVIPRLPGMPESGLTMLLEMMRSRTWACSDAAAAALVTRVRREVDRLTRLDSRGR